MTRTKEKRLYLEDELPLPGDIIEILAIGSPILKRLGDYNNRLRWITEEEKALVVAVDIDRFKRWLAVLTISDCRLGWVECKRVATIFKGEPWTSTS